MKKKKKAKKRVSPKRAKVSARPVLTPEIVEPRRTSKTESEVSSGTPPSGDDLATEFGLDLPIPEPESAALVSSESQALSVTDPVARYMAEVNRYPLLTREQEEEVAKRYFETKDPRLAEVLVTSNLRFVVKVAAEYSKFGSRLIDLIQEGNVGLMHAVREFNPYKGVKLITYAVWWIRGYIQEYLMRQYSLVRIGTTQNQRKLFYQLQREKQELDRLGDEAGIKQISGKMGIPEEEVADMRNRLVGRDVSLSRPVGPEEGARLLDLQSDESAASDIDGAIDLREHLELLNSALDKIRPSLNEKETYILENRLLSDEPLTLQEIGESWKVTREAVRQMESRLLSKIRKTLLENGLPNVE